MKRHLKRINAPKSWMIARKEYVFTAKARPGPHPAHEAIPLAIVLRDMLHLARTNREVKHMLSHKQILVDGKRRVESSFIIGLLDVISIMENNVSYRMTLTTKGMLHLVKIDEKESQVKLCKIISKHLIKNGLVQLTLHDGRNISMKSNEYKTSSSLMIGLPGGELLDHYPMQPKMLVFLTGGTHIGETGHVEQIEKNKIIVKNKEGTFETLKKYAFIIGKDVPVISVK